MLLLEVRVFGVVLAALRVEVARVLEVHAQVVFGVPDASLEAVVVLDDVVGDVLTVALKILPGCGSMQVLKRSFSCWNFLSTMFMKEWWSKFL